MEGKLEFGEDLPCTCCISPPPHYPQPFWYEDCNLQSVLCFAWGRLQVWSQTPSVKARPFSAQDSGKMQTGRVAKSNRAKLLVQLTATSLLSVGFLINSWSSLLWRCSSRMGWLISMWYHGWPHFRPPIAFLNTRWCLISSQAIGLSRSVLAIMIGSCSLGPFPASASSTFQLEMLGNKTGPFCLWRMRSSRAL